MRVPRIRLELDIHESKEVLRLLRSKCDSATLALVETRLSKVMQAVGWNTDCRSLNTEQEEES